MNATTFKFTLDIHDIYSQFRIRVKKGDTSGRLIISLMENGKPYHITENCYAVLAGVKEKGGGILHNKCTIENNAIIYHFTKETTSTAGVIPCDILLYDQNDRVLVSPSFTIEVYDSVYSEDEVENSNEFSSLANLISAANTLVNDVTDKLKRGEFIGEQGPKGKDGVNGKDGVGIKNAYINAGKALTFELTDGRMILTSERVVGDDGKDGVGITKVEKTPNLELVVTLSNGTVINLGSIKPYRTEKADTTDGITEVNKDDVMRMFVGTTDEWEEYDGSKDNVVAVFTDEDYVYPYKQRLWSDSSNQIRSGETLTVGNISNQLKIGDCLELKYTITYQDGVIYHCRANCYVSYVYSSGVKVIETDNFFTNSVKLVCECPNSSGFRMVAFIDNEDISYITLTDIYKIVE